MRKTITTVAALAVLTLSLTACDVSDSTITDPGAAQSSPAVSNEKPADDPTDDAATEEEPEEEAPAAEVGTRENPAKIGQTVTFSEMGEDSWEVTLGKPTLNANKAVAKANQFNDPAPEGMVYAMVPVTVKRLGEEAGTPWVDLSVKFVSAEGTTHTAADTMAVAPDPSFNDINELYKGAKGKGNVVIAVPKKDIKKGTWSVSVMLGDEVFFKAK